MAMMNCSGCGGFVPETAGACPNCGVASPAPQARGYRLPRGVMAVLGGVAVPMTLMACYGGPTTPKDACLEDLGDGGTKNVCVDAGSTPDAGGTPDAGNADGG
jgi:hypothetical protein